MLFVTINVTTKIGGISMENINTTATPLPKASGLPEKQKKAATILGIIILAGTVLATLIDTIYNIIFYTVYF